MRRFLIAAALLLVPSCLLAQSSASYKLTESSFNNGGDPVQGVSSASASYHISVDAAGEFASAMEASSPSYHLAAGDGLITANAPPVEVAGLLFTNNQTMIWSPQATAAQYEIYRGAVNTLISGGTGTCFASGLTSE